MELSISDLYYKILKFEGEELYESVLKNWAIENDYKKYTASISNKIQTDKTSLLQEDIWELYALTRVLDLLTLRFQPNNITEDSEWSSAKLSISEYVEFNNLIGLDTIFATSFNAFDCEILEAHVGENDFQINECLFPAVRLENLMLKRAGVKISLNPKNHNLTLVNNASIYWAFRRKNRRYLDLSQGWGSNSQWRTDIRLDIETNNSFIYNLKGTLNLNNPTTEQLYYIEEQGLEIEEAIELTKFRHFITSTKDDSDLFPYDFKYEEKKHM